MTDRQATGNVSFVIAAVDGCFFKPGKNKGAKRKEWAPSVICSVQDTMGL